MPHQTSFAQTEFADKKKITRREKFLTRMEEAIPWAKLLAVIEPHYPKAQCGSMTASHGVHGMRISMRARNFSRRVIGFLVANSAGEKLGWCGMSQV